MTGPTGPCRWRVVVRLPRMNDFDPDELGGRLRAIAGELGELSDRLQSAADGARSGDYRAADADGLAEVTVDGRPRVVELRLHPDALRSQPEELDQLLTGLLNDALGQARAATQQALLDALPGRLRADVEQASGGPR